MRAAALSEASTGPAERAIDSPPSAVLRIKAVRKFYEDLEAIRNVSFDVADGEFLSLLGPSGCGKSTLLMMVAGLIEATEGEISINGKAVSGPRSEVGVVFQQPVLLRGARCSTTCCSRSSCSSCGARNTRNARWICWPWPRSTT